jgi:hypothetical protein
MAQERRVSCPAGNRLSSSLLIIAKWQVFEFHERQGHRQPCLVEPRGCAAEHVCGWVSTLSSWGTGSCDYDSGMRNKLRMLKSLPGFHLTALICLSTFTYHSIHAGFSGIKMQQKIHILPFNMLQDGPTWHWRAGASSRCYKNSWWQRCRPHLYSLSPSHLKCNLCLYNQPHFVILTNSSTCNVTSGNITCNI